MTRGSERFKTSAGSRLFWIKSKSPIGERVDTIADYERALETIDPALAKRLRERQAAVAAARSYPGRRRLAR